MFQQTIIIGRLTRDPEQKAAGQSQVTRFSVAVDEGFGDKKKTHFFNVAAWSKLGDSVMAYTKKGSVVAVQGEMLSSKPDAITYWELRADKVKFLPSSNDGQGAARQSQPQQQAPQQQPQNQTPHYQAPQQQTPAFDAGMFGSSPFGEDALPF